MPAGSEEALAPGQPGARPASHGVARSHFPSRAAARSLVHLGLLLSIAGAFGTLQLLHIRNAIHADVGLAFAALVLIHLAQRRQRVGRMLLQLGGVRHRVARELRRLGSDSILAILTVNVVASGVLDWGRGEPLLLPLPMPLSRWHLTSSALLVVYVVVHVSRRRKRLRHSTIR